MANIFELDQQLSAILAALEDGDVDQSVVEASIYEYFRTGEMADKVDAYCALIKEFEARASARRAEAARLSERAATADRAADRLRYILTTLLVSRDIKKLETPRFGIRVVPPRPHVVVTDEEALPEEFRRVQYSVDKSALMAALKSGARVSGAELAEGKPSIVIR